MKTFQITIDMLDGITGLDAISLVEYPAVEYDFLKFNKQMPLMPLRFEDDERHIITGVAILADTPILRVDSEGNEYQVIFSKKVIRQLVEKYAKLNLNNSVNIEHRDDTFVEGVIMTESYIIDKERGICPNEFSECPDGSWIISYKVENNEVWDKIKSGEVKGFSVQGIFNLVDKNIMNYNKTKNTFKMKNSIKNVIKNLLLSFGEVETDKGFISWEGDKQLEVGDAVYQNDEPAADGEYKVDDKIFVIAEGKVAEIKDEAVEEPKTDEPKTEELSTELSEEKEAKEAKEAFNSQKLKFEETYNEIFAAIQAALNAAGIEGYVFDAGDGFAIVSVWEGDTNKTYRYEITIDENGAVTLGERVEVIQKVSYEPIESKNKEPKNEETEEQFATEETEETEEPKTEEPEEPKTEESDAVKALEEKITTLEDRLKAIEDKIDKPAAEPVVEEFKSVVTKKEKGNLWLDVANSVRG